MAQVTNRSLQAAKNTAEKLIAQLESMKAKNKPLRDDPSATISMNAWRREDDLIRSISAANRALHNLNNVQL